MSLLNKHFWKFLLGFFVIMAMGIAWLFGAEYYHYVTNEGEHNDIEAPVASGK